MRAFKVVSVRESEGVRRMYSAIVADALRLEYVMGVTTSPTVGRILVFKYEEEAWWFALRYTRKALLEGYALQPRPTQYLLNSSALRKYSLGEVASFWRRRAVGSRGGRAPAPIGTYSCTAFTPKREVC